MNEAAIIHVRCDPGLVKRVDDLADRASKELGCTIKRSTILRALAVLYLDTLTPELLSGLTRGAQREGGGSPRSE